MSPEWISMLQVQAALWLLYALLPWLALRRLLAREPWPMQLAVSVLSGVTLQMVLGKCRSAWIPVSAEREGWLFVGIWLVLAVLLRILWRRREGDSSGESLTLFEQIGMVLLLLAGLWLRLLHPLDCSALGQSDAYSHLAMFREVLATGQLGNAVYPSGYAWVMVLPSALLGLDPYGVARFGGAFWGAALSLTVFGFLFKGCRDRQAGVVAAFLVAVFPGLNLLIKTGIGAFANQAGLLILPMLFAGVPAVLRKEDRRMGIAMLVLSAAGILLSVPMLLLHVVWVLVLFWGIQILTTGKHRRRVRRNPRPGWLRWSWVAVPVMLAGLWFALKGESRVLSMTARVLTSADEAAAANQAGDILSGWTAMGLLIRDYVGLKHWGVDSLWMNMALTVLMIVFAGLLGMGIRRRCPEWILIGLWGLVTAFQTATGCLQFTAYQREGWSLMLAMACLGGLVGAFCWRRLPWLRIPILLGVVLSTGLSFWNPPAHRLTTSCMEEPLVDLARHLQAYPDLIPFTDPDMKGISGFLHRHLDLNRPLRVVTRPFLQDRMLSAVTGSNPLVRYSGWDIYLEPDSGLKQSSQTLVLLDGADPGGNDASGQYAAVNPVAIRRFLDQQRQSYGFNAQLEEAVRSLPDEEWQVDRFEDPSGLTLIRVAARNRSGGAE